MQNSYIKRIISKIFTRKKVYFLVENSYSASTTVRGHVISNQFRENGVYSYVFDLRHESKTGFRKVKNIKNSYVIIIKRAFRNIDDTLEILKNNNNTLIWDPLDELVNLKEDKDVQMFDGVLWANKQCQDDMRTYFRKDCLGAVIHHHWDPQCKENQTKEYRLVYLGDPTPENISKEYIENIKDINIASCSNIRDMKEKDLFTQALDYSCQFSVRKEGTDSFKYKPNAKLAFASGMHANVILSHDCSNIELLDKSYPYYTSSDLASVKKIVEFSKDSYGTKIWNDALEMIREVRDRLALERISKDYIRFLSDFQ